MPTITGVSHLLLDIEGTTCPVSFVADTLFPYAAARLERFIKDPANAATVGPLLSAVTEAWRQDEDPEARAQWQQRRTAAQPNEAELARYLKLLIAQDRKLTPLKDLQGLIWRAGYADGELVAPLFSDVPPSLKRWSQAGLVLGVYSSGSLSAQRLLYSHSDSGDLSGLFSHWFDTRSGAKAEPKSYRSIAAAMAVSPPRVLFISDSRRECEAASRSGLQVLFSRRPGNPEQDPGVFATISDYNALLIHP